MVRAFQTAAIASLTFAAIIVGVYAAVDPSKHLLTVMVALVITLCMIAVHARVGTRRSAAAFIIVGGASAWWIAFVAQREIPEPSVVSSLTSLTVIPLVLVGGAGAGTSSVVGWSVAGFVVGRLMALVGAVQAGGGYQPAILAWITLGLTIGVVVAGSRTTAQAERVQAELLRSAREEHVWVYRQHIELEAAAILHDTLLSHLSAIALAPAGKVDPGLVRAVDDDLSMLAGQDWLSGDRSAVDRADGNLFTQMIAGFRSSDDSGARALDIDLSGNLEVLDALAPDVLRALVGAVGQCIANVEKHAHTDHAEVNVFDDGRTCTVMVVDAGRGFDQRATGTDRLGLKNSVRRRVEAVGGEMQLWSAPGTGTSVMLSVPIHSKPIQGESEQTDALPQGSALDAEHAS
jgi:signal transduction histidine kinase